MTPNFEALSDLATRAVAAEANHSKAAAALAAAHAARDVVTARLADITAKRQEIIVRRAEGGDLRETDAADLALLDADAEGLRLVLGRHDGTAAEAEGPLRLAANVAATAKLELQRAELRATEAALLARILEIERAMIEAGRGLRATRDALGSGMLAWVPSDELMMVITPARGQRRW